VHFFAQHRHRIGSQLFLALLLCASFAGSAFAQPEPAGVEVEPLTCWWRTTAGSVRVGEPFFVVLTCSLLQTASARVLLDESRLDASVLQLPPFEIIGGARANDRTTATQRFLQYTYTLRLIAEDTFGSNMIVPPLQLSYRIESQVEGLESAQGRDLTYSLPPLSIRVVSLVPDNATDIREAPVQTFGEIDTAAFRATVLRVVALILLVLGALVFLLALIGYLRRGRAATAKTSVRVSTAAILRAVRRALVDVQEQSRDSGWTSELAGQALTPLRIAAAYALNRPVNQVEGGVNGARIEGQLAVNGARGKSALISAPVAADGTRAMPEELRTGLARFTAVRYGRQASPQASALDDSIRDALRVVDQLAARHTWMSEAQVSVKRSLTDLRERVWAR
jgi:hypothetical protein